MRTLITVVLAALAVSRCLNAQTIHTPAEIMKIMENSPISYRIENFDADTLAVEKDLPLIVREFRVRANSQGVKELIDDGEILAEHPVVQSTMSAAEKAFIEMRTAEARRLYVSILDSLPEYSRAMVFVGQTFEQEKEFDKAIEWYRKAIGANPIDYMAHWFLADARAVQGDYEEALEEILLAHALNRNNPRIRAAMGIILNANSLRYVNAWSFQPLYRMERVDKKTVSLAVDPNHLEWLMYGMAKAVWEYETGYREEMEREHRGATRLVEEQECLMTMMAAGAADDASDAGGGGLAENPTIRRVNDALEESMLTAFILYEILLVQRPEMSCGLTDEGLRSVIDYIRKKRIEKIQ